MSKVKVSLFSFSIIIILTGLFLVKGLATVELENQVTAEEEIRLPLPRNTSTVSVEEALSKRRSVREYKDEALTLEEVSCLLWAAQGITSDWGGRTAPSAGALYPLEIYLVIGNVKGLARGVYHYRPSRHLLVKVLSTDKRTALFNACLWQSAIKDAPITVVISAAYQRTTQKYGERGKRYVYVEVGHVGQNIYLQAETLGLKTVAIGAFNDAAVKEVLKIKEEPLYIMPVGKPKDR